jgi:hypothetical protein
MVSGWLFGTGHFVDVVWLGLYFFLYLWGEKLDWSSLIENFALW